MYSYDFLDISSRDWLSSYPCTFPPGICKTGLDPFPAKLPLKKCDTPHYGKYFFAINLNKPLYEGRVKRHFTFAITIFFATIAMAYAGPQKDCLSQPISADRILVLKGERKLILLRNGRPIKEYHIALGRNPTGRKVRRGDGRTPEGIYRIDSRNIRSQFHMALHISYPNKDDIARARARGVSPGRMIMIHGLGDLLGFLGEYHTAVDWTGGCIAVTNEEIEEIWKAVPDGIRVEIRE
jgi:hypothetical protein